MSASSGANTDDWWSSKEQDVNTATTQPIKAKPSDSGPPPAEFDPDGWLTRDEFERLHYER